MWLIVEDKQAYSIYELHKQSLDTHHFTSELLDG